MTLDTNKSDEQMLSTIQQEYKILAEYKMIASEKIEGVYVIPSYGNSLLWFGVIFIRSGFYVNGMFRFQILLPNDFPDKNVPEIIFEQEMFHPLVCPFTRKFDTSHVFPNWREGEDHIWQVLKFMKFVLRDPWESLKANKYANQNAADLLSQNTAEFIDKTKECVASSLEHIYDPPTNDDQHYIVFEKYNSDIHKPFVENVKNRQIGFGSSISPPPSGLSWVKKGEFKPLSKE